MSNEKKAKKSASAESIIVRTTLITFAALIGLSALFLLLFPLCFPSAAANTCDRLGMDSVAVRYYKVAYERNKTVENFENKTNPKFEVFADKAGEFRFRLKARNGEIIDVGEGYKAKKR